MHLGHIHKEDRRVLYVLVCTATALALGLSITGIWQLVYHEPDPAFAGYVVGLGNASSTDESSGVAWVHGTLGDAAGILTLFGGAWVMVRVSHKFSWFSAISLLVIVFGLITGGVIRFNASVQNGVVDVTTAGYAQFFSGDAELAVTDRAALSRVWIVIWTTAHVASVPVLMASAWYTFHDSRRRRAERKAKGPSWLQGLESRRP